MNNKLPSCGIDFLLENKDLLESLSQKKIGVLTNQGALTKNYQPSVYALVERLGDSIKFLLTPEHGWSGLIGEGVNVENGFDSYLKLPILSLYGADNKAIEVIQKGEIDLLLIDLQDAGLRCYTYTATCAKLLEACADLPLEVIICDRPNPLGPQIEGPLLESRFRSIVGYLEVPFQHGQTIGQLLSKHKETLGASKLKVTVIPCQSFHQPYAYPWIPPSPNLPSWDAVLLYPALVLLEGTNVSEGRGTSLPFTCLGAPSLDNHVLVDFINSLKNSGVQARPISFTPQSGDLIGKDCLGAHLLLNNPLITNVFSLGVKIIHFLRENYLCFQWDEFSKDCYFIDYLMGGNTFRKAIDQGLSSSQILEMLNNKEL